MLVREAMSHPVITVTPGDSVALAARIMWEKRIHQLPVVDESQKVVGIITDRDVRSVNLSPKKRLETPVANMMTPDPISVGPEAPIEEATLRLFEKRFGALPVVDSQRRLVGIVTRTDILNVLMTLLGMKQHGSRLVVELPADTRSISKAFAALEPLNIPIASAIVSYSPATHARRFIHLRLGTIDPGRAAQALTQAGFKIEGRGC